MPVIVSTMPPMRADLAARSSIAVPTLAEDSATWRIASVACAAARTPSSATPWACWAASAVLVADSAEAAAARAASWTASRVDSTIRTWRSAPWATSVTAEAISPTARPASSDVAAICCEAEATVPAPLATSEISVVSSPRIVL